MMNYPLQQPSAEFRQCFGCNYEAVTAETVCPRCRKTQFLTSSNIRKRGIVVVLCGLFISGLIGGIAIFVAFLLLGAANDPSSSKKITANQGTIFAVFGFFILLIGLGLQFVVTGGWMLAFGKRSRVLIWLMWAFLFVVFAAGGIISVLID